MHYRFFQADEVQKIGVQGVKNAVSLKQIGIAATVLCQSKGAGISSRSIACRLLEPLGEIVGTHTSDDRQLGQT